jgi:hypothetical protein
MQYDPQALRRLIYQVRRLGPSAAAREFELPECPRCGVEVGLPCRGGSGYIRYAHRVRIVALFESQQGRRRRR